MKVYAHDPTSLLPLLESRLPASIAVVGAIRNNPEAEVFATFSPPASSPNLSSPEEWMVVAVVPSARQLRLFHSLEASLNWPTNESTGKSTDESTSEPTDHERTGNEPTPTPAAIKQAQATVAAVVLAVLPQRAGYKLGAVHVTWAESLRAVVGGPAHTPCTTFLSPPAPLAPLAPLAPPPPASAPDLDLDLDLDGLVLDHGRPGDEDLIHEMSGYRTRAWYAAHLAQASVARARGGPVAWVLTVADGSVGALYTLPSFRRRGLAKAVLAHRLARMGADPQAVPGFQGFCHVEVGNNASEAMWTGLGWTRGHRVVWIYDE
ncbi:hypothetical protein CspeluHIS016_0101130 [Cutaneotrichosporon spelunceum]|uniref:GCN5-related N-acetyltransferase Rv2170-like domain-containing protein n=1 Tax=Cutaneotrichosporon spelunceum TaxID=1672016 RepID=A0AAD3Y977_9TREE|nr:hypothetical protein CspeluHIS016_0101130 [Cutaneotrichosporon spelunceum]